jgi:hypothetical protein
MIANPSSAALRSSQDAFVFVMRATSIAGDSAAKARTVNDKCRPMTMEASTFLILFASNAQP